jgi:hypothetical protein
MITVTTAGRELLGRAPSLLQDQFHAELAKLKDWERFQLLASLQRIAEMMDVEALDASPFLVTGPVDSDAAETRPTAVATEIPAEPRTLSAERGPKETTEPAKAISENGASNR